MAIPGDFQKSRRWIILVFDVPYPKLAVLFVVPKI